MSCPSAIHTVSTNVDVAENGQIPFGSVVRRYGRNCQLNGTGINLMGAGYYDLESSLTFTPTATGPVTIQFYQDGIALPGATMTVPGTAAEPIGLYVTSMPRNCGCDCNTMITATISAAGTANNFSTVIRKD